MAGANASGLSVCADRPGAAAGLAPALTTTGGVLIGSISGLILTQANVGYALHSMLLTSAFFALLAALRAAFVDRNSPEIIV